MTEPTTTVRRVQDTARWVAMARALESERRDAHFTDPFARKLAGRAGEELVHELSGKMTGTWPIVARTCLIDPLVLGAVRDRAEAVLNLAAGLDSRPYRLDLPPALTWLEVDLPDVIADKERVLGSESPRCRLERVAADLSSEAAREKVLDDVARRFERVLVLTEGLLPYLERETALGLARDLRARESFFRWIADLPNAAVLRFIAKRTRNALQGTAAMRFGPDEGPRVFEPLGWKVVSAQSIFKAAGRLERLSFPMSLFARLPERPYGTPGRPWSGVCVFEPKR